MVGRRRRNQAARAAIAAGWTLQNVADRVGVLPGDVARWVTEAERAASTGEVRNSD